MVGILGLVGTQLAGMTMLPAYLQVKIFFCNESEKIIQTTKKKTHIFPKKTQKRKTHKNKNKKMSENV